MSDKTDSGEPSSGLGPNGSRNDRLRGPDLTVRRERSIGGGSRSTLAL
jgi:hypothetical protein